jgi:hypothetical protein
VKAFASERWFMNDFYSGISIRKLKRCFNR